MIKLLWLLQIHFLGLAGWHLIFLSPFVTNMFLLVGRLKHLIFCFTSLSSDCLYSPPSSNIAGSDQHLFILSISILVGAEIGDLGWPLTAISQFVALYVKNLDESRPILVASKIQLQLSANSQTIELLQQWAFFVLSKYLYAGSYLTRINHFKRLFYEYYCMSRILWKAMRTILNVLSESTSRKWRNLKRLSRGITTTFHLSWDLSRWRSRNIASFLFFLFCTVLLRAQVALSCFSLVLAGTPRRSVRESAGHHSTIFWRLLEWYFCSPKVFMHIVTGSLCVEMWQEKKQHCCCC